MDVTQTWNGWCESHKLGRTLNLHLILRVFHDVWCRKVGCFKSWHNLVSVMWGYVLLKVLSLLFVTVRALYLNLCKCVCLCPVAHSHSLPIQLSTLCSASASMIHIQKLVEKMWQAASELSMVKKATWAFHFTVLHLLLLFFPPLGPCVSCQQGTTATFYSNTPSHRKKKGQSDSVYLSIAKLKHTGGQLSACISDYCPQQGPRGC